MDMDLETFFTASTQIEVFLISCVVGIVLGIIYDIFRVFRIVIPHSNILTNLEDVILISAYGIFLMCFAFSLMRGQIRFFFIVGNFLGFILWFFTLGSIIIRVANRIKGYLLKAIKIVTYPIRRLLDFLTTMKKKVKKSTKNT